MTTDDKLRELGKALPWERPDDARRDALRSSLLVAAEARPPVARRPLAGAGLAFAAGVLAAAAVAVVVVRRSGDDAPAVAHAQITASPAAEVEHTVTSTARGTDEVIRVRSGTVAIASPGARPHDRVRVVTRDGEVEGPGAYDVTVAHDALTAVAMRSGTARVTIRGHADPVFLSAGEVWRAEVVTAELVPAPGAPDAAGPRVATVAPTTTPRPSTPPAQPLAPTRPIVPAPRPATLAPLFPPPDLPATRPAVREPAITRLEPVAPSAPPRGPSAIERHFQAGSALLRANQLREAAVELAAAADASEVDPLSLDARYLQATALIGSGQPAAAERALVAFLDHAPHALRRGRAAVMLARLIAARGDVASARAWFTSALRDPDRDVARAAQAGLDQLPR